MRYGRPLMASVASSSATRDRDDSRTLTPARQHARQEDAMIDPAFTLEKLMTGSDLLVDGGYTAV